MGNPNWDAMAVVGRIARAHGIRGHVIVNPETDFMEERFRIGQRLLVGAANRPREYEIEDVRFQQGRPVVRFTGVCPMNEAETMPGSGLGVKEGDFQPLPAGTFYRHELVGCEVRNTNGEALGRVTAVEGSLDRSYLVVDEHVMIPLVADIWCESNI